MRSERGDTRRLVFVAAVLLVGYVASLAFAVGAPTSLGDRLPSCGSPLLHGITFTVPSQSSGWTADVGAWSSSPWCAAARTQRAVDNLTIVALALVCVATVVWLARRRAAALKSGEPISVAGGIVAALLWPVGSAIGLWTARQRGTRRMLLVQLEVFGVLLAYGAVFFLGSWASNNATSDQGVGSPLFGAATAGWAVLTLLPFAYPLTLIRRRGRRSPGRALPPA